MKFGDKIFEWARKSGEDVFRYGMLKASIKRSPGEPYFAILKGEIGRIDSIYARKYRSIAARATVKLDAAGADAVLKDMHDLYEYAVWNLLAIEKIVKKHDKNVKKCPLQQRVHRHVSESTFLGQHLDGSSLYMMIPALEEMRPDGVTADISLERCNVCIADVKHTITMDCGHKFCLSCASKLSKHYFTNCPTCRAHGSMNPLRATATKLLKQTPNTSFALVGATPVPIQRAIIIDEVKKHHLLLSKSDRSGSHCNGRKCGSSECGDNCPDELTQMDQQTISVVSNDSGNCSQAGICELRSLTEKEILMPDFLYEVQQKGEFSGVGEDERMDLMNWLWQFSDFFGLAPDTYATAASLVDRMLATIVIKPEHADLVGMACLRIAARLDEPEDIQPTLRELHINCGQAFSEADIERMEKIVDKKLCGPFPIIAFDFINPMLELCADCDCGVCALVCTHAFEKTMIHSVLACYACYELQSFRSSTLALAMLIYRVREKLPDLGADAFVHVATRMREAMSIQEWEIEHCVSCISRNESCAR